jgi:hypothetical protein
MSELHTSDTYTRITYTLLVVAIDNSNVFSVLHFPTPNRWRLTIDTL